MRNFFGWKINAVLRPEMTRELLKKLAAANCHDIIYGVESGSPRVLALMNKPYAAETAERVLRETHEAGIATIGNFMFGFPGEREEDFQMTLDFVRRNKGSFDRVYASATFTSLEENSALSARREEFGIRGEASSEAHHLYWESEDGTNDYLVRLERYERFRKLSIELGLDAYKGVNGSVEQDKLSNLAQFHRYKGDHLQAVRNLLDYLELDLYSEPLREELGRYRSDLALLARALCAAEKAARRSGPEKARWTARAQGALAEMRDGAELVEGEARCNWGRSTAFTRTEIEALWERAGLMLDLAESEMRTGAGPDSAAACAR